MPIVNEKYIAPKFENNQGQALNDQTFQDIADSIERIDNHELNNKVDKVEGKQLSTNDYTTIEKEKLGGIEENANNYIHPDTHPATMITGLPAVTQTLGNSTTNVPCEKAVADAIADIVNDENTNKIDDNIVYFNRGIFSGKDITVGAQPVETMADILRIGGETVQKVQAQGKNLIDPAKYIVGFMSGTSNNQYQFVSNAARSERSIIVKVNPNTAYTYSAATYGNRGMVCEFDHYPAVGDVATGNAGTNGTPTAPFTFTTKSTTAYVIIYFCSDAVLPVDAQLEEGAEATAYEPFTPAMPSPEYPSAIIGAWGKNLVDINDPMLTGSGWEHTENGLKLAASSATSVIRYDLKKIIAKPGKYTWSYKVTARGTGSVRFYTEYSIDGKISGSSATMISQAGTFEKSVTFIISESSLAQQDCLIYFAGNTDGNVVYTVELIMLEEGAVKTAFEPYGCIGITACGKNLFDVVATEADEIANLTVVERTADGVTVTAQAGKTGCGAFLGNWIHLEPGTYTASRTSEILNGTAVGVTGLVRLFDMGGNIIAQVPAYLDTETFTVAEPTTVRVHITTVGGETTTSDITAKYALQLENGAVATDYEPYRGESMYFPVDAPLYAIRDADGNIVAQDYVDIENGKVVRNIGIAELDGTRGGFPYRTPPEGYTNFVSSYVDADSKTSSIAMCTHLTQRTDSMQNSVHISSGSSRLETCVSNAATGILPGDTDNQKLEKFNAWLTAEKATGTPVTVVYQLETPIEIDFTDAQKAAVKKLTVYKDATNIFSDGILAVKVKESRIPPNNSMLMDPIFLGPANYGLEMPTDAPKGRLFFQIINTSEE